jgi:DNA-binding CsgD family transcriptional regulator
MPKAAAALAASPKQLAELHAWLRSPSLPSGLAQRARIVTLAADGVANSEIAELLGCSRQTVITWRQRFTQSGIAGLSDRPRPGRPATIDVHKELEIVAVTLAGAADPGRDPLVDPDAGPRAGREQLHHRHRLA